jgi:hypothetical protein
MIKVSNDYFIFLGCFNSDPIFLQQTLESQLNQLFEIKKQIFNYLVPLNSELDVIVYRKCLKYILRLFKFSNNLIYIFLSYRQKISDSCKPLKKRLKTYQECNDVKTPVIKIDDDYDHLNTGLIAQNLKQFLYQNQIREEYFAQKILRTSYLSLKNVIDLPKKWSTLNSVFKSYFKRAYVFLSDAKEMKIFLSQPQSTNKAANENHNFIHYDISQMKTQDYVRELIESVVKKLNEFNLNRKVLCDAVLGIPLNTLSFFCTRTNDWKNQSDYAKEAILRMQAWFIDPNGVQKLSEWKKKYYTSIILKLIQIVSISNLSFIQGRIIKSKCASRTRRCINNQQLNFLLAEFQVNSVPSKERVSELCEITKLSELTIMTWFRNRRYNDVKTKI